MVLVCVEITSDLDQETQQAIYELPTSLRDDEWLAILMISHDTALVERFATDSMHLACGQRTDANT